MYLKATVFLIFSKYLNIDISSVLKQTITIMMIKVFLLVVISSAIGAIIGDVKPPNPFPQNEENIQKDEAGRIFGSISPHSSGQFYPIQGVNNVPYRPDVYPGVYPPLYGGYQYYRPQMYGQSANYLQSFENYYRKNNQN